MEYNNSNRPIVLTLDDKVLICEVKHTITYTRGYYLDPGGNRLNDFVFQKLNIDPRIAAQQVYGYDKSGSFPFADTLEDLTKMVNFLMDKE